MIENLFVFYFPTEKLYVSFICDEEDYILLNINSFKSYSFLDLKNSFYIFIFLL